MGHCQLLRDMQDGVRNLEPDDRPADIRSLAERIHVGEWLGAVRSLAEGIHTERLVVHTFLE